MNVSPPFCLGKEGKGTKLCLNGLLTRLSRCDCLSGDLLILARSCLVDQNESLGLVDEPHL